MLAAPEEILRFGLKETSHCRAPECGANQRRQAPLTQKETWQHSSPSCMLKWWGLFVPRLCLSHYFCRTLNGRGFSLEC